VKRIIFVLVIVAIGVVFISCSNEDRAPTAQERTTELNQQNLATLPEPVTFLDFNNYRRWFELSEDAATIQWCTVFPPTPGQEPFTIAVVGKLTSSELTPFPTSFAWDPSDSSSGLRVAEKADPFGMYGVRASFLYGFTPTEQFYAIAGMGTLCTTEPLIIQRNNLAVSVADDLVEVAAAARAALEAGDGERAMEILRGAGQ
jgi:hypothetical protein